MIFAGLAILLTILTAAFLVVVGYFLRLGALVADWSLGRKP